MTTPDLVTSPSDWPETFPQLRNLDTMLRCGICFDFMDTVLILPQCSHNYCSLCIRRYIGYKPQCPACAKNVSQSDLKNNRIVDDIIKTFTQLRSSLLKLVSTNSRPTSDVRLTKEAKEQNKIHETLTKECERLAQNKTTKRYTDRNASSSKSTKTNSYGSDAVTLEDSESSCEIPQRQPSSLGARLSGADGDVETDDDMFWSDDEGDITRTKDNGCTSKRAVSDPCDLPSDALSLNMSASNMTSPSTMTSLSAMTSPSTMTSPTSSMFSVHRTPVTRVDCPVCGVSIPDRHINMHLDQCLRGGPRLTAPAVSVSKAPLRKPLPKLVYNLMKDAELKKRLTDVCLPTQGDRQTLIRRHQDYTVMYNSQCDSLNPMPPAEIAKAVVENEKCKIKFTKVAPSSAQKFAAKKGDSDETVSHAQRKYVTQHKSQFSNLLSQVKRRLQEQQDPEKNPTSAACSSGAAKSPTSSFFQISDSDSDADLPGVLAGVLTDSDDDTPDQSLCDGVSGSPPNEVLNEILDGLEGEVSDCEDVAPLNNKRDDTDDDSDDVAPLNDKRDIGDTDDDSDVTVDNSVQAVTEEEEDGREEGSDEVMPEQNDEEEDKDETSPAEDALQGEPLDDSDADFQPTPIRTKRKRKKKASGSVSPKENSMVKKAKKNAEKTVTQDDPEPGSPVKKASQRQLRARRRTSKTTE